jgi:excisionase family DNA binding protein
MDKLLTVEEVADMLGVEKASVYGMVFKSTIPCLKISGRMLRFSEAQLMEWLKNKAHAAGATQPAQRKQRRTVAKPRRTRHSNADVQRIIAAAKKDVTNT